MALLISFVSARRLVPRVEYEAARSPKRKSGADPAWVIQHWTSKKELGPPALLAP